MRRIRLTIVLTVVALVASVGMATAAGPENFRAHLGGDDEVPAVDTRARGQAVLQLDRDGTALDYRLNVANIDDVLMAHLHLGQANENGPVVVWLYPEDGPPPQPIDGRTQGTLATGTITQDELVGPLAGADLGDLVDAMRAGEVYVNVHTESHPSGEVRGQVR